MYPQPALPGYDPSQSMVHMLTDTTSSATQTQQLPATSDNTYTQTTTDTLSAYNTHDAATQQQQPYQYEPLPASSPSSSPASDLYTQQQQSSPPSTNVDNTSDKKLKGTYTNYYDTFQQQPAGQNQNLDNKDLSEFTPGARL